MTWPRWCAASQARLESTSRVEACWVNPDKGAVGKLTFDWPHGGQSFSFDLGGRLRYGSFDGQLFYAEVKKYSNASDLGTLYQASWPSATRLTWTPRSSPTTSCGSPGRRTLRTVGRN
jgi:hypothetical protein